MCSLSRKTAMDSIHGATIRARLGERFCSAHAPFAPITISLTVEYRLRGASPNHRAGTSLALPRLGESCISNGEMRCACFQE
jgi:hypothetical protein